MTNPQIRPIKTVANAAIVRAAKEPNHHPAYLV